LSPNDEAFEPEDAVELVGIELPPIDEDTWVGMAQCFIEEYVRMGCTSTEIMDLARNPFYRALHDIVQQRGEAFVQQLIDEAMGQWRPQELERPTIDTSGSEEIFSV
jgi:hypothetical protein